MKTAISISDDLFKAANKLAKRLKIPRSRLFALAVEEFIENYNTEEIAAKVNEVYKKYPDLNKLDPYISELQWRTLKAEDSDESW